MSTIAMSDNGRVLIPAELREQLGFKPKSRLYAEVKDGSLVLTSAQQRSAQRRAYFASVVPAQEGRSLSEELIAERRQQASAE